MNSKQIPEENLRFLNDLLDRELEEALKPSSIFDTIDVQSLQSQNISNKRSNEGDQFDFKSTQMQSELATLQNKLLNLEQKMQAVQSDNINPLKNQYFQSIQNENFVKQSDSEQDTPLKKIYPHFNQINSAKKKIKFHEESQYKKQQQQQRTPIQTVQREKQERVNKFEIEKSIEEAETRLHQSKGSVNRSASRTERSKGRSSSRAQSQTMNHEQSNVSEVRVLNSKIQMLKKAQDEEKHNLIKEKQKNIQLVQQVEKLNKQVKKLQQQLDKNSQLEQDYQKLQDNFEKSEYIRSQQKILIQGLKSEIEKLKGSRGEQNVEPLKETTMRNQSSKQKTKKKS